MTEKTAADLTPKLRELDQEIGALKASIADLEAKRSVALAEAYVEGDGVHDESVASLQGELSRAQERLAERQRIRPLLIDKLQEAKAAERRSTIDAHSAAIVSATARMDAINGELRAIEERRTPLIVEINEVQQRQFAMVNERSRLEQRTYGCGGTLEAIEALRYDPDAPVRPDELERYLREWRDKEAREDCQITYIDLTYEVATGKIITTHISGIQSKEELKSLKRLAEENQARKASRAPAESAR